VGRGRAPARVTHRRLVAALVLLGLALYVFPLVLDHPLIDPDEGLHAAIAQAMVEGGDYVTPRFLREPFPDKPVFFFWALAGSLWAFGFTEAAARAPGLLFGLLGAATTGLLAGTILGRRGGWLAAIFYATLSLPIGLMQMPVHDLALVPFTNGALLAFWRAARAVRAQRVLGWSLLAGVCLGGAILTKGLSGVAIVGLAHVTVLLIERRLRVAVIVGGALALITGLAVAAPWFMAMEQAHPGYLDYYLFQRHVLGFTTATQRHGKSAWHYYLPVVLGGGLPWILYAPFTMGRRRPRASDPITESRFADGARLGWSLLLTGTLFLSLSKSKLLTYALPLFPAIALLAAVAWLARQQRSGDHPSRWFGRMTAVQAGIAALLLPGALIFAPEKFAVPQVEWMWVIAGGIAAGWWSAARVVSRHTEAAAALGATMTATTLIVALAVLVPPVANVTTAKDLAETINRSGRFPPELWMVEQRSGSLVFYLDPALRRDLTRERVLQLSSPQVPEHEPVAGTCVAVTAGDSARLAQYLQLEGQPFVPAGHYRMYDGERLLHRDAPLNQQPVPAHAPHHRPPQRSAGVQSGGGETRDPAHNR
jgi:4-amino-4-deoxy-L-arabinose transferase-like glycosyltransferase